MTQHPSSPAPHRVVIAGAGVAGLEALIALRDLAGDRVDLTLVAPTDDFVLRALSVRTPFAHATPTRISLDALCADYGAHRLHDAIHLVHDRFAFAVTQGGEHIPYDSLLLAVGAHAHPAVEHAITFRGLQDEEAVHGLIQDVEGGYADDIAFVVPQGVTWPLPLYELALQTAERAFSLCLEPRITIVTPEPAPLAAFGTEASERVAATLAERGIELHAGRRLAAVEGDRLVDPHGETITRARRVVALPVLSGPRLRGVTCDEAGFAIVDAEGRVRGSDRIFAAGDGTTIPIKQGGVAGQQADAAAHAIARRAGAAVPAAPFEPVLRAELLTGSRSVYLRSATDGSSTASEHALWWPPTKVAAPYLSPYLERVAGPLAGPAAAGHVHVLHAEGDPAGGIEVLGTDAHT